MSSEASDGQEGSLCVCSVMKEDIDDFRDLSGFVSGTVHIIDCNRPREFPCVETVLSNEFLINERTRGTTVY